MNRSYWPAKYRISKPNERGCPATYTMAFLVFFPLLNLYKDQNAKTITMRRTMTKILNPTIPI